MDGMMPPRDAKPGPSALKLALGAAGLFLFIVGVKRTLQIEGRTVRADAPAEAVPEREAGLEREVGLERHVG